LQEQPSFSGVGIGSIIWWVLSLLISLYLGGSVAGRLAGILCRADGLRHGLLTWGLVTLLSFFLLSTALGRIIGGVTGVVGQALLGADGNIVAVAPEATMKGEFQERGIDLTDLKREAAMLLHSQFENQSQEAALNVSPSQSANETRFVGSSFDDVIDKLFGRGEQTPTAAEREAAVNVVVQHTGKSYFEAEQIVSNWQQTYEQARVKWQQTKQQATAQADATAEGLSKAALLAALGLGLGAAAAAIGGRRAAPRVTETVAS